MLSDSPGRRAGQHEPGEHVGLEVRDPLGGVVGAALGVSGVLDQVLDKIDRLGLLLGVCVLVYLQSTPVLGWMVVG